MITLLLIVLSSTLLTAFFFKSQSKTTQPAFAASQKTTATRFQEITPTPTAKPKPITVVTPTPTIQAVVPKNNTLLFGVVVDDYANNQNTVTSLEKQLDTNITTLSIFKQFGNQNNKGFNLTQLTYSKQSRKKIQLAWEPWNPEQGSSQAVDYLKEISQGTHDTYIRQFAQSIKQYGSPVTLRFGHEMNGDWYPWGKRPEEYIAAYRHIHTVFQQEGVTNVQWMWCVNITENPSEINGYYPGSDVVDVIGIDGFNFGTTRSYGGWRSFSALFQPTYQYIAAQYDKPIIIAEIASSEQGGNKEAWVNDMFYSIHTAFPRVNEVIWFNLIKEADWRIDSSSSSLNAFKTSL